MRYVLGLAFTLRGDVLMVEKNRPSWQAGKLNFIGGKIEGDETPLEAMVREFEEETGIHTVQSEWQIIGLMGRAGEGGDENAFEVIILRAKPDKKFNNFFQIEDEKIILVPKEKFTVDRSLDQWYISNIRTIYEFAVSKDCDEGAFLQIGYQ